MSEQTGISWTDATFNPWWGCTKVSPACDNCYAERDARRFSPGQVLWGVGADRRTFGDKHWNEPRRWNAKAEREAHDAALLGLQYRRPRVFCASMADVFDTEAPDGARDRLWELIRETPALDWLLLTKRIGNAKRMLPADWGAGYRNVWLGATVVDQGEVDRDVPKLLATPARTRFLSMEPLLGPVTLRWLCAWPENAPTTAESPSGTTNHLDGLRRLDWVIVGGESGPHARPMHPEWARLLRDQCAAADVAFHFKQWGEWLPWHHFNDAAVDDPPERTRFETREWTDGGWMDVGKPDVWDSKDGLIDDMQCVGRVGKKAAGRLLDGIEHNAFPRSAA